MLRIRLTLVLATVLAATVPAAAGLPAEAAAAEQWSPPVAGPVVRGYEPPERPFGPRHLGLDYAAPPGTPVRAAGHGVVAFAGLVGRGRAVSVDHTGGRRTTYAYLTRVLVRPGSAVRRGDRLGLSGARGPGHATGMVHFGYRVAGIPHDPALLFGGPPRVSLAPLDRPACPARRLGGPAERPATLSPGPTAPGRARESGVVPRFYSTRSLSIGVRRRGA